MNEQSSIFDLPASIQARDAAIRRVEHNAEEDFKEAAFQAVCEAARAFPEGFIVDQVWAYYEGDYPHEGRAMGPVMLRAKREGIIIPTDDFRPSAKVTSHAVPRRVWRAA